MKPISQTHAIKFSNGQKCTLRFTADENGVTCDKLIPEPLRFNEIEDEYTDWRDRVAHHFTRTLPAEYVAAHALKMLTK